MLEHPSLFIPIFPFPAKGRDQAPAQQTGTFSKTQPSPGLPAPTTVTPAPSPRREQQEFRHREDRSSWLHQHNGAGGGRGEPPDPGTATAHPAQASPSPATALRGKNERHPKQPARMKYLHVQRLEPPARKPPAPWLSPGGVRSSRRTRAGGQRGTTLPFPTIIITSAEAITPCQGHRCVTHGNGRTKPGVRDTFILGEPH